jgi:hypothetical protein
MIPHSNPSSQQDHQENVAAIQSELKKLQDELTLQGDNNLDNIRSKYADTAEWARHYSTVRMTVATFVITTCVAIVALKPDKLTGNNAEPAMVNAVCLLWLLGSAIFYAFTYSTYKALHSQSGAWVALNKDNKPFGSRIHSDLATYVMFILNSVGVWLLFSDDVALKLWGVFKLLLVLASASILVFMFTADKCIQAERKNWKIFWMLTMLLSGPVVTLFLYVLQLLYSFCGRH